MAKYSFKLQNLEKWEMGQAKRHLRYFVNHGVKITYLKKVAYIHLNEDQSYSCIFNYIAGFYSSGKLQANEKSLAWLQKYYGKLPSKKC